VEDLIGELHVDPNVVSQVTKVYTEFLEVPTRGWETCESPPDPTTIISVTKKIQEEKNQALPKVQIGLNEKKDKHSHQLQYIHEKLYINMSNVDLLKISLRLNPNMVMSCYLILMPQEFSKLRLEVSLAMDQRCHVILEDLHIWYYVT
jgi:hypothetical protein